MEPTLREIANAVNDFFKVERGTIEQDTRKREVVQKRQYAHYFAKKLTKHTLESIGNEIGNRDHATVLNSCRTALSLYETDKIAKAEMDELNKYLQSNLFVTITTEEIVEAIIQGLISLIKSKQNGRHITHKG